MFKRFVAAVIIGGVWMLLGELLSIAQPVIAGQPLPQGQKRDHVMQARDNLAAVFIPSQLARAQEIALSWHGQWEEAKGRSGASLGKTAQSQPATASLPGN